MVHCSTKPLALSIIPVKKANLGVQTQRSALNTALFELRFVLHGECHCMTLHAIGPQLHKKNPMDPINASYHSEVSF